MRKKSLLVIAALATGLVSAAAQATPSPINAEGSARPARPLSPSALERSYTSGSPARAVNDGGMGNTATPTKNDTNTSRSGQPPEER